MKSVEEKLLRMSACGDRLKMAVLYFLGTAIRGRGRYNAPFASFILRVVNNVIKSVIASTIDEETPMARIMEDEADYENEEGPSNLWSLWLTVKEKSIWWKDLYELNVAARDFSTKTDKRKVNEEASSSNASLEDVLKGIEKRLMTCLSEVNVKVETMNKRLCVMEKSQVEKEGKNNAKTEPRAEIEEEVQKESEEEVQKEEELNEGKEIEEEPEHADKVEKEARIYMEEEKKRTPAHGVVKHRPKVMAVRKHAPKKRGRPRKADKPHKFTTPPPIKRTRTPSQYVTSPFIEANTDEVEGRKKKPRTKA
ncbi:BnaAnng16750D [Brassica napus]|uniref:BnaAnng16750D protein n=1 Tax=Brassica napus TaxID=3708 RepID=A0A078J6V3_BRANA|nr:BnaAnng16750D [Brassica napus]